MPNTGSLTVRTFVSRAQLPVPDATVIVYTNVPKGGHRLLAIRATNESGITDPIDLPAGDGLGQVPNGPTPYENYQLIVEHPDYQLALFTDLQVFPDVQTTQDVPLIPLSPDTPDTNSTTVTPQPL